MKAFNNFRVFGPIAFAISVLVLNNMSPALACEFNLSSLSQRQPQSRKSVIISLDSTAFFVKDAVEHLKVAYGIEVATFSENHLYFKATVDPDAIPQLAADSNVYTVDIEGDFDWVTDGMKSPLYEQKINAALKQAFDKTAPAPSGGGRPIDIDKFFVMKFIFEYDVQEPLLSLIRFNNLVKKLHGKPGICKVRSVKDPTRNSPGIIEFQAGTGHAKYAILDLPGGPERSRAELVSVSDFP